MNARRKEMAEACGSADPKVHEALLQAARIHKVRNAVLHDEPHETILRLIERLPYPDLRVVFK